MGANGGASGNKLQTNTSEDNIAIATNRVYWNAQKLEARGHYLDARHREEAGERLTDSVAQVARLAFATIDDFGTSADKASLVAKLDDLLSSIKAEVAQQTSMTEPGDVINGKEATYQQSQPRSAAQHAYPPMPEEYIGQIATM